MVGKAASAHSRNCSELLGCSAPFSGPETSGGWARVEESKVADSFGVIYTNPEGGHVFVRFFGVTLCHQKIDVSFLLKKSNKGEGFNRM